MKCWITLTSHFGTVNAGTTLWSNEGRPGTKIRGIPAMSFRSMDMQTFFQLFDAIAVAVPDRRGLSNILVTV
jgi:hypothetical protein